jgi:hypothetical protein
MLERDQFDNVHLWHNSSCKKLRVPLLRKHTRQPTTPLRHATRPCQIEPITQAQLTASSTRNSRVALPDSARSDWLQKQRKKKSKSLHSVAPHLSLFRL